MTRFPTLLSFGVVLVCAAAAPAWAQTTKTSVLGWTGTGEEIVTQVEQFGEVMVDDAARDYWFETTQMRRARDGQLIQTYRRGEATGAANEVPTWSEAKPETQAAKYLENAGLVEAVETDMAPNGQRAIVTVARKRTVEVGDGFRCAVDTRVMIHDVKTRSVWVVAERTQTGETVSNVGEVVCVKAAFRTWWHPDSAKWLVELTLNDSVSWLPGNVSQMDDFAAAPFSPADFPARVVLNATTSEAIKKAWRSAFDGDLSSALATLSSDTTGSVDKVLMMALFLALNGDSKASLAAAKQAVSIAKTTWTEGLLGCVYMAAGDAKRAQKVFSTLTKKADSYEDLARIAAVLSLVDLELSNKVFIHALSHPTAAEAETSLIYAALIQGLIEVGENEAASELLGKVPKETGLFKLLQARLALMTNDVYAAEAIVDDVLFTEPGRCMVYGLAARLAVLRNDTGEALEHYRAASLCSVADLEARYYVADLEARRGDLAAAARAVDGFLKAAAPRRNDVVRDARRTIMRAAQTRYAHQGIVLLTVSCRARVCQGQAFNATDVAQTNVAVAAFSTAKSPTVIGSTTIQTIPARSAKPFMVRTEGDVGTITVGNDPADREINLTSPTP
ncbi:MAG: hypothetical protein R3E66_16975 [bacterium]